MRRRGLQALALGGLSVSALPTVVLLASTATAAPAVFGQYSTSAVVRASSTGGNIGLSGGLTPLDSGSASVDASLDNSPTAMVLARPMEPGTSFSTVASQVPVEVAVPEAQAAFPGKTSDSTVTPAPGTTASATATPATAVGSAETAGAAVAAVALGATTASASLGSVGAGHEVSAVADGFASGFEAAGVLVIRGVRGHAAIAATAGGTRTSIATLTVGSISVSGQAVAVDDSGLHAVGTMVPFGPTLAQLTKTANSALASAGISISLAAPIHTVTTTDLGSHCVADSGGLQITVTTREVGSATVPANTAVVTLGRVQLSESDASSIDLGATLLPGGAGLAGLVGSTGQAGTPGIAGTTGQLLTVGGMLRGQAPSLAGTAPAVAGSSGITIAGHHLTAAAAVAALGGWEALTLGSATFAVLALRRPELEEELLCPCPV